MVSDISELNWPTIRTLFYFDIWISNVFLEYLEDLKQQKKIFFERRFNLAKKPSKSVDIDLFMYYFCQNAFTKARMPPVRIPIRSKWSGIFRKGKSSFVSETMSMCVILYYIKFQIFLIYLILVCLIIILLRLVKLLCNIFKSRYVESKNVKVWLLVKTLHYLKFEFVLLLKPQRIEFLNFEVFHRKSSFIQMTFAYAVRDRMKCYIHRLKIEYLLASLTVTLTVLLF